MDILNNIIARPGQEASSAQQKRADAPSREDMKVFIDTLVARSKETAATKEIEAKLARVLEGSRIDRAKMLELIKETPGADLDTVLKNLADQLQVAPEATPEVKPALISDLTANISTQLQEAPQPVDPETLLKTLQDKFAAIDGATPENLEAFRTDAIDLMKSMGMSAEDMEAMFVKLAMSLQEVLPGAQLTQLMMPVKPEALIKTSAASAAQQTAAPVDMTPQQLAEQQLQASAKAPAAHKAPATATDAAKDAPAPQQTAPQPQQQSEAQPAKPQAQTSNLALLNSFADNGGSSGGFGGQSFQQQGYALPAAPAGLQASTGATAGSFMNHMSAASGTTPTTQMIALQIQHNAQTQVDTFRMQLNPLELGRLEVRLKFGRDGSLKAHLIADKPETLNSLQKDQAQLQRILQQAGLDVDDGALSFDLRQQHQDRDTSQSFNNSRAQHAYSDDDGMMPADAVQAKISVEATGSVRQSGVNIMV